MDDILKKIVSDFEVKVRKLNKARMSGPFKKLKVSVLGQQGLLVRKQSLNGLQLVETKDFDAFLKGEPPLEDIFKMILKNNGLHYDNDSEYIWLPDETEYEMIYESECIVIDSPLPIFLIISKAVKAPEKNKALVVSAISEYGEKLLKLMEKYEADIEYFIAS